MSLLPILIFFVAPMLSSMFSGGSSSGSSTPRMVYDNPLHPYTEGRSTLNLNINYFVNPDDIASYTKSKLHQLDRTAEVNLVRHLRNECDNEIMHKRRLIDDSYGWFFQDEEKMARADAYVMHSCERLKDLGVSR